MNPIRLFSNLFYSGNQLTITVKKNIIGSLFLKGLSVLISLLYVPITLNYLNPTRYGIWMTLTSIIAWMSIFDIGIGNGLRNKLAESIALGKHSEGRKYVSTAYVTLSTIVFIILSVFLIINHWIDWSIVLNTEDLYREELSTLVIIVVFLFGLKYVLNIISTILTADQRSAYSSVFEVIGNLTGLILIYILTIVKYDSIITFGIGIMLTPVIVYSIATYYFFKTKYSFLRPSIKLFDRSYIKSIMNLGILFFIIQISSLIIFQTSNILISHFFSPAEVTPYNIVFKYFSIPTMIWGIIMMPMWSAFTKSISINDMGWVKRTLKKLNLAFALTIPFIALMVYLAPIIIPFWTNGIVNVKFSYIVIFAVYSILFIWNTIYAVFLNGASKIKIQAIFSISSAIIHIPLSFIIIKLFNIGSEGIIISMAICLIPFAVAGPWQTLFLIKKWSLNNEENN